MSGLSECLLIMQWGQRMLRVTYELRAMSFVWIFLLSLWHWWCIFNDKTLMVREARTIGLKSFRTALLGNGDDCGLFPCLWDAAVPRELWNSTVFQCMTRDVLCAWELISVLFNTELILIMMGSIRARLLVVSAICDQWFFRSQTLFKSLWVN